MNELISLTQSSINGELQQTVNARELHAFLESKHALMIGLQPVLTNMDSLKIKTLSVFPKIRKLKEQTEQGISNLS